jgi:YHS domain-containing protein
MKKIVALALLLACIMPLAASQALAAKEKAQTGIVDVGNKICPVMGGAVDGKNFAVYEGKRYGLCCSGCEKAFLSDPAKYIAQTEVKTKTPASLAKVTPINPESEQMQKDMEQGDL